MKLLKRNLSFLLGVMIAVCFIIIPVVSRVEAAKTVKLDSKRITVAVGKSMRLKLQNNKKNVSWSIVSGKGRIKLKQRSKTGVTIVGKKAGNAAVRAKAGGKSYTCRITVKQVQSGSENDKKTLIAYFSMAVRVPEGADAAAHATPSIGSTESVAMEIQKQAGGDLFAIKTVKNYPVSHSACSKIASEELEADARPELSTHVNHIQDYDIIYIGFPIWVYREPMAIRTFLEEYDFTGKTLIPFCTSMAVGIEKSIEDIKKLCPDSTVLDGQRFETELKDYEKQVVRWMEKIGVKQKTSDGVGTETNIKKDHTTPIILTSGDMKLNGYLYDNAPAKSLISQLPLTVTLNDSDNDFCGGNIDLTYSNQDVSSGYKNGDLAFWTPGNNFVIFVDDEEKSADTGDLVMLGKLTETQKVLDSLKGTLRITIELADRNLQAESTKRENNDSASLDQDISSENANLGNTVTEKEGEKELKIKITADGHELTAVMEDNAASRAFMEKLPMTLPMLDLYGREMCYRFDEALPTDSLTSSGYVVGDLAYWPPRHSLVILYEQNGEHFERQHLGHINSGVEVFRNIGNVNVTFDIA